MFKSKSVIFTALVGIALCFTFLGFCGCGEEEKDDLNVGYDVYIPNMSDSSLTKVPAKDSLEQVNLELSRNPRQIALKPGSKTMYILFDGTNQIGLYNIEKDEVEDTFNFEVGTSKSENYRIIFTPDAEKAFISTSYGPSAVSALRTSDKSFIDGVNVGSTTVDRMYLAETGDRLFATDPAETKIYSINTSSYDLVEEIIVPESFSYALFDPDKSQFYMAEEGTGATVKLYDMSSNTFIERAKNVTDEITKMIVSDDGKKLYVLGSSELVIMDLSDFTINETIVLQHRNPTDMVFLPDNKYILMPSGASDLLMLLNPKDYTLKETIDCGQNPGEIVVID